MITANMMCGLQLLLSQAAQCGQDSGCPDAPVSGAVSSGRMCPLSVYTNGAASEVLPHTVVALQLRLQDFPRERDHRGPMRCSLPRSGILTAFPVFREMAIHADPLHPNAESALQLK